MIDAAAEDVRVRLRILLLAVVRTELENQLHRR